MDFSIYFKGSSFVITTGFHGRKPLNDSEIKAGGSRSKPLYAPNLLLKSKIENVVFRTDGDGATPDVLKLFFRIGLFGDDGGRNNGVGHRSVSYPRSL